MTEFLVSENIRGKTEECTKKFSSKNRKIEFKITQKSKFRKFKKNSKKAKRNRVSAPPLPEGGCLSAVLDEKKKTSRALKPALPQPENPGKPSVMILPAKKKGNHGTHMALCLSVIINLKPLRRKLAALNYSNCMPRFLVVILAHNLRQLFENISTSLPLPL